MNRAGAALSGSRRTFTLVSKRDWIGNHIHPCIQPDARFGALPLRNPRLNATQLMPRITYISLR